MRRGTLVREEGRGGEAELHPTTSQSSLPRRKQDLGASVHGTSALTFSKSGAAGGGCHSCARMEPTEAISCGGK